MVWNGLCRVLELLCNGTMPKFGCSLILCICTFYFFYFLCISRDKMDFIYFPLIQWLHWTHMWIIITVYLRVPLDVLCAPRNLWVTAVLFISKPALLHRTGLSGKCQGELVKAGMLVLFLISRESFQYFTMKCEVCWKILIDLDQWSGY